MRVAIVGGSGLLGRHIAAELAARGDAVIVLSRDPTRVRKRWVLEVRVARWSPNDPIDLARTLHDLDAVINLAGVAVGPRPWTRGRRKAIVGSRLEATAAIRLAIARIEPDRRPRILLSVSGTDSYTDLDATPATEATPPANGFLARVCLAWEAEAAQVRSLGLRVPILRIGFVLARDAKVLSVYALPFRLGLGGRLGSGRQWMSWIHVDDLVGLVLMSLDDPRIDGVVNAVSPTPARQAEFAGAIAAGLGQRSWLPVPAKLIRLAMGAASTLALGSRRIVPERALALGYRFRWPDLSDAMADVLGTP
jgi:uncharacterized protein (TIGR01777 family)